MTTGLVPYERQREERIKRNTDIMIQMGVLTAAQALNEAILKGKGSRPIEKRGRLRTITAFGPGSDSKPQRRSSRLRGEAPAVLPNSDTKEHRQTLLTANAPCISKLCQLHVVTDTLHIRVCATCVCLATGLAQAWVLGQHQPWTILFILILMSTTSTASGLCQGLPCSGEFTPSSAVTSCNPLFRCPPITIHCWPEHSAMCSQAHCRYLDFRPYCVLWHASSSQQLCSMLHIIHQCLGSHDVML